MIPDIFSELQRPGPFAADHEARRFADADEQAVLADRLGFGCWWTVDHHGAVEFNDSSAPEIVVAALSQRTERLRFGDSGALWRHGVGGRRRRRARRHAAFNFGWAGIVIGMLMIGAFKRALHEPLYQPNAAIPAQILAVVAHFAFPQSLQAQLFGAVNSAFFGGMPLLLAHWLVRITGGTTLPARAAESPGGFATHATAGI